LPVEAHFAIERVGPRRPRQKVAGRIQAGGMTANHHGLIGLRLVDACACSDGENKGRAVPDDSSTHEMIHRCPACRVAPDSNADARLQCAAPLSLTVQVVTAEVCQSKYLT
jgi:hypothetical protein